MDIEGIGTPIEVSLNADLKVIEETLTRCGIVNKKRKISATKLATEDVNA